jgi:hypothetical protein
LHSLTESSEFETYSSAGTQRGYLSPHAKGQAVDTEGQLHRLIWDDFLRRVQFDQTPASANIHNSAGQGWSISSGVKIGVPRASKAQIFAPFLIHHLIDPFTYRCQSAYL